jgi:hypothetical protein
MTSLRKKPNKIEAVDKHDMSAVLEEIESKSAVSRPQDEEAQREYSPVTSKSIQSSRYDE